MPRPFPAYQGDDPYVFVCYSHKDAAAVYAELTWLRECGFNIWYDEGIEAGTEWSEDLANHIEAANLFLFFITLRSAESQHCRNEVNFALGKEVPILAVHITETDLPGGLSLSLSARQAILKHMMPEQEYREKLQRRMAIFLEQKRIPTPVTHKRSGQWRGSRGIVVVAILLLGIFLGQSIREEPASEPDVFDWAGLFSIAVLPFEPSGAEAGIEAISKGLSDVVVEQLTQKQSCALKPICQTLKVVSADPDENIANRHQVQYVLHGTIQQHNQLVQIRAQLVRADNSNVWSKTYTHTLEGTDVFNLQAEVANSIAELSAVWLGFDLLKLYAPEHPALASVTPAARAHFLKAREQALLTNTGEGGDHQIQQNYLEKSIQADPQFALAYLRLSEIYTYRYGGMSLSEATTGALTFIEKAIALNPIDPENLLQAGQVHLLMTLNYRRADELLQRGMDQYPDWGWFPAELSMIAAREGRTRAALNLMSIAAKIPFGFEQANFHFHYAWLLYLRGHYDLALTESSRGLELASGGGARADLLSIQWLTLIEQGKVEAARSLIEEGWKLDGTIVPESYIAGYARTGQEARARDILADLEPTQVNQYFLATGYLALGDLDGALTAIDRAITNHNGLMGDSLKFEKIWNPIRCDPRFEQAFNLLEQMETLTEAGQLARSARKLKGTDCESSSAEPQTIN